MKREQPIAELLAIQVTRNVAFGRVSSKAQTPVKVQLDSGHSP
jgi:glutamine amidotransferase PdxT